MPSMSSMFSDLKYRLRAIFHRKSMENELAAELQFHCEQQAAKLVAAGVPPDEALRRARLAIGGVEQVKEECREARGIAALESTAQDFQYGLRQVRRTPGFALVVIVLAGARHRRQHGDLQPHRRAPAPHAADRRPGRASPGRSPADKRRQPRRRIPRVSSAARSQPGVRRRGGLRHDATQCQHRRQPRANGRRSAGLGNLLSASRRRRNCRAGPSAPKTT